jgi:hypothetical protein
MRVGGLLRTLPNGALHEGGVMRALLVTAALLVAGPTIGFAQTIQLERRIAVDGDFAGKNGKVAKDLSGIACEPAGADQVRRCLLVNDEGKAAQWAKLRSDRLTPGQLVRLIGDAPAPTTLGTAPEVGCPQRGDFAEFDGEGVAYAAPFYYVIGSHGCSRQQGEFRLSSFHLARIRPPAAGHPDTDLKLTYRVSDVLRRAAPVNEFFGKRLMEENGLNLEGIAIAGDQLILGLRAPSQNGTAYLIRTNLAELFAPGHQSTHNTPEVTELKLGKDRGIRDLAMLDGTHALVLAGPAQEQEAVSYTLSMADWQTGAVMPFGDLPLDDEQKGAKAEAIVLLGTASDLLQILVLWDGLKNGAPTLYRLVLR